VVFCLLMAGIGTKRDRAYATDVRSWWKLTYKRSGGIRVLTHQRHWLCTAAMVLMPGSTPIKVIV
jgi:hypothetical protein